MWDCNVIDIGLRVIKRCGMYSKEYKNWIAREHESPPIVETIDSFKEYWSGASALVNQTAAPASQHGYSMAAVNNDASIVLYTETITNFGAAYESTQDTMKSQAASLAAMQGQLGNIQQFCMAVGQQPPSTIYQSPSNNYAPMQQQRMNYNCRGRGGGRGGGGHGGGNQQPTWYGFGGAGAQQQRAPTPFKQYKNWNYCFLHGSDIDNAHMSKTCGKPGRTHNRYATRANMMGGTVAGMHKSILPSAAGRTAPPTTPCPQQQQATYPPSHHPPSHMSTQGPAPPPAYYTGMPPTGGTYRQRTTMAFPTQAPGQVINILGQYPPGTSTIPMMPQHIQQTRQMMTPYTAPNQQPYQLQYQANQQQQG